MKAVALVSSGIDSPVAVYLLSKYLKEIIVIHMDNRPFTDNRENEKFVMLARHLKKILSLPLKAYIVPHGKTLETYKQQCNQKFTCVVCKRMMVRYAEAIARKEHADAIIMGDSLGQVASQTLRNIRVVESAVTLPILRPLIGLDKEEITRIAKTIHTYELSIKPSGGCTAVPVKPSTNAFLERIIDEEARIDIPGLVTSAVAQAQRVQL